MNRCKEVQNRILEGVSLSPEDQNHLSACQECQEMADFCRRMSRISVTENGPSAEIDSLLIRAAEKQNLRKWVPVFRKFAVPAAAVFTLSAGILFYQSVPQQSVQTASLIHEISYDDEIFNLAMDLGAGMSDFSETVDLVI